MRPLATRLFAALAVVLAFPAAGSSAEVRLLASNAFMTAVENFAPEFERTTGDRLIVSYATSGAAKDQIEKNNDMADVVILSADAIDELIGRSKLLAASRVDLAQVGVGVMVKAGAPMPDISSVEAFRKTLLAAKSIAYSDPAGGGASGKHFSAVLQQLNIGHEIKAKEVLMPGARVGEAVANGRAEIGIHTITEILPVRGVQYVGPLPETVQSKLVLTAAIPTDSRDRSIGERLLNFLKTDSAREAMRAAGHETRQ